MYVFVENLKINDKLLKFYFLLGNSIHFVMSVEISRKHTFDFLPSLSDFCRLRNTIKDKKDRLTVVWTSGYS